MASPKTIRDPKHDHLLTPQNAALVIIDYQPVQVASIASRSKRELVTNITGLARIGKLYGLPVVLSTARVASYSTGKRIAAYQAPSWRCWSSGWR